MELRREILKLINEFSTKGIFTLLILAVMLVSVLIAFMAYTLS